MWDIIKCLEQTISSEKKTLIQAQLQLENQAKKNVGYFISQMSKVLADAKNSSVARQAAGLQLKNSLTARDPNRKTACQKRWCSLPAETRKNIRKRIFSALGTEAVHPSCAAQCLAYICSAELVLEAYDENCLHESLVDLIDLLDSDVQQNQKEAAMETIGFICQEVPPEVLENYSSPILSQILVRLKETKSSKRTRLVAAQTLFNSLQFIYAHFEIKGDRNLIMQRICDTTQSSVIEERVIALQTLAKIPSYYYIYIADYMDSAITPITFDAIISEDVNLSLQGMEFWCSVAEIERDLANNVYDPAYAVPDSCKYTDKALPALVPLLVTVMAKWQDDPDSLDDLDEWTPVKGAVACLSLLSECCPKMIDSYVLPEVHSRIEDVCWKQRVAALWALSAVLEDIDIEGNLKKEMASLWELTRDPESVKVRYAALMLKFRIFQICPSMIPSRHGALIRGLIDQLKEEPRIACVVCDILSLLFTRVYQLSITKIDERESIPQTFSLTRYFKETVNHLLQCTEETHDPRLKSAAYQALKNILLNSPDDCHSIVYNTVVTLIPRVQKMLNEKQQQSEDFQTLICATLSNGLFRLNTNSNFKTAPLCQEVMWCLLTLLRSGVINETLLSAFSKTLSSMGPELDCQIATLFSYLKSAIELPNVCPLIVALTGNSFSALGPKSLNYLNEFCAAISRLLSQDIGLKLRAECITALNEMMFSFGLEHFQPHVELVLSELHRASEIVQLKFDDPYCEEIQEIILQGYGNIMQHAFPPEFQPSTNLEGGKLPANTLLGKCLKNLFEYIADVVTEESPDFLLAHSGALISSAFSKLGVIETMKYSKEPSSLARILTAASNCPSKNEYQVVCQAALVALQESFPSLDGLNNNIRDLPKKK